MSKILDKAQSTLSMGKEKLPGRALGLAPGDSFFTRIIEFPESLPTEERLGFVELELESHSPFPAEQMMWGCWMPESANSALLYASTIARLANKGFQEAEAYHHLLPSFLPVLLLENKRERVRFLVSGNCISAVHVEADTNVPLRVISRVLPENAGMEILLKARAELLGLPPFKSASPEDGLWIYQGSDVHDDDSISFDLIYQKDLQEVSDPVTVYLHQGSKLWNADLRSLEFAKLEAKRRRQSNIIWKSLLTAFAAVLILLFIQISSVGLSLFNSFSANKISEMEPRISRIQDTMTLATRLSQSTNEDIKPFHLLEFVNTLRPDSIYFESIRAQKFNELEIEGKSSGGVSPVNAFADTLLQQDVVSDLINNSETKNSQTSFTFLITFNEMPELEENIFTELETSPGEDDKPGGAE